MKNMGISLYLFWGSVQDIKTKSISANYLNVGFAVGSFFLLIAFKEKSICIEEVLVSLSPGIFLLLWSRFTKEKIGYGDGFMLLIMGMCMEEMKVWYLCQLSFLLCAIFSIGMMGMKKLSKVSTIPFVPFLCISYLILWRMKYV